MTLSFTVVQQRIHLTWMRTTVKKKIVTMRGWESLPSVRIQRPRLSLPHLPSPRLDRPARYFSKGPLDADRRRNPTPIPYLLTETHEIAQARPIPGHSILLRSLCKGKGVLKKSLLGLVYLDIDNGFITSLLPFLKIYRLSLPPYFNFLNAPEGAHIPIITSRETAFHSLDGIQELGREFSFELEGLYSVEPTLWPEVEQVWFFKLHSPTLEKLRRRYFLSSTPGGHSFHIAVAIKPRIGAVHALFPLPMMQINVGFLAA